MTKFRTSSEGSTSVINYMGARSFAQTPKEELIFAVLTSFIEDSYYESKDKRLDRIRALTKEIAATDPHFIAHLALITRKEFHMRSSSHVLVGELARIHRGDSLVRDLIPAVAERPDDLLELVAYLGKPIPNGVKKGIAKAITGFNEYQLAKYKGEGKSVKLADALNLTHPKPLTAEQQDLYQKVINGKLAIPKTWETRLSAGEKQVDVWRDMLKNNKLGYMALLRNLRNIMLNADDETVELACLKIADRDSVLKSKQLPFRFLSAYNAVTQNDGSKKTIAFELDKARIPILRNAIETAVLYSVDNIPLLKGRTMILSDNSGSMRGDMGGSSLVSVMSKRTMADIANLFALLYWTRAENTYVGLFGDRLIEPELDRSRSLFKNFERVNRAGDECGPSTEAGIFVAMRNLIESKTKVDRIVIFSDCQVGDSCKWYGSTETAGDFNHLFQEYRTKVNPTVVTYSIDLKGYGNKLFSNNVILLSGWSEKIFDLMRFFESDSITFIDYVEKYPLTQSTQVEENDLT